MTDTPRQIGQTGPETSSLELEPDQLGPPGVPTELHIVPVFKGRPESGGPPRFDGQPRQFIVETTIRRSASESHDLNGAFDSNTAGSYIKVEEEASRLRVETSAGDFELHRNQASEISMFSMRVEARDPTEARLQAQSAASQMLDHLSFLGNVPIFEGLWRTEDVATQTKTLSILGPERPISLGLGIKRLHLDLAPIYGLYREYKNSYSIFYKTLCLYKIMEGMFTTLKPAARKRSKLLKLGLEPVREYVPDHAQIDSGLRHYIGKPLTTFYGGAFEKQYRNSVAHFLLREGSVLNVSSAQRRDEFAKVTFLAELCVRNLVENHEAYLDKILEAEEITQSSAKVRPV